MALTSLEAIAQKLQEKKQNDLETILKVSGSAAISKNEYGVTIIKENDAASSLLFKPLVKSKIDDVELVKAIDTEVKELKPNIPEINRNLVPKPLYDDKVVENTDLTKKVTDLTTQVDDLSAQVSDLKSQVQSETNKRLSIEQTNDVLVNQLDALSKVIDQFSGQIQSAVQKSVDESILRASLQSQNAGFKAQIEALIKQIDSLNAIIEGLQAQLGAVQQQQTLQQTTAADAAASGADVINKLVLLKFDGPTEDKDVKLRGNGKAGSSDVRWSTGGVMKFTNNGKSDVTIAINHTKPSGIGNNPDWINVPEKTFTMKGGATKDITLGINYRAGDGIDSQKKGGWFSFGASSHSANYDSTMKVTVTAVDGTSETKEYKTRFGKMHPSSF